MERVSYKAGISEVRSGSGALVVGKPPWSSVPHSGKLERMIVHLGAGKGKFYEVEGIPRSIGCIGNNRFILRREPLGKERIFELVEEFRRLGGKELWLTNYDDLSLLMEVAEKAVEEGVENVYAVVLIDDVDRVTPVEGVKFVAELEYSGKALERLLSYPWLHGALIMVRPEKLDELTAMAGILPMEVYVDVLFPGSARRLNFNVIELRRIMNPTTEKYHDCLAGTIAVSADGYLLPCPLLRNYVVVDLKEKGLKEGLRKKRLRDFWRMTKDSVNGCSKCPFKYICHDCRALEYQATGEINGMEYCPVLL
ncbi:SPASM domain-containing protein [Thermococcus sp.]|uniref:SPASM domain-containing protein n=1 Tax=Thermococcus sp. TaxID=35749 RepID=UPI0026343EF3|nr:SPASM domain-containing protein [Thermococcus sp.]